MWYVRPVSLPLRSKCTVAVDQLACTSCHNTKTMQTGAGIGKGLTGKRRQELLDERHHVARLRRAAQRQHGVKGVESGKAMPIPYTNSCGAACHDAGNL